MEEIRNRSSVTSGLDCKSLCLNFAFIVPISYSHSFPLSTVIDTCIYM